MGGSCQKFGTKYEDFEGKLEVNENYNNEIYETRQEILSSSHSEDIEINNGIVMCKRKNKRLRILSTASYEENSYSS